MKNTKCLFWVLTILLVSCTGEKTGPVSEPQEKTIAQTPAAHNTLSEAEKAEGWQLLFDGKTTNGWKGYLTDTIGSSWHVEEDALYLHADVKEDWAWKPEDGGWLMTDKEFENFEFRLQWKITDCGNSGIVYHVIESEEYSEPWRTGPEMQVLDNKCHPDGKIEKHRAGDLYDLIAGKPVTVKPAGEWNDVRIVCDGNHLEHWLNGQKVVETEMFTESWKTMIAASKFGKGQSDDSPGFGTARKGHIALQDHNDSKVWYRNIKIKELPVKEEGQ